MDERSFLALYETTVRPLRSYITRVLGGAAQADDVLQESYLRLLRAPSIPTDPVELRAFLFRIAGNLMVDDWRRHRRERGTTLRAVAEAEAPRVNLTLRLDMARVFERLKPQHRQLLWLAYVEGASHREIAAALGVREASIRVLLHRARQRLAELLAAGRKPIGQG
jgi:RNA polymerase sigma-70 factor (ECF subfamily)